MIVKIVRAAGFLLLFALPSTAQAKGRQVPEGNSPLVCVSGFHEESWLELPMNDVPGQPVYPTQKVKACFPNCPKGYQQVSGTADALRGHPACLLAESDETDKPDCIPLNLKLVYRRAIPLVWHWRAEISQPCGAALLKKPIEPQYHRVAEELHGEGVAHFLIVVGQAGRVVDSTLIDFNYTTLPPGDALKTPLSPTLPSLLAADTLTHLEFEPFMFRKSRVEFQTTITIVFKLNK
jgi:hypothetical protein